MLKNICVDGGKQIGSPQRRSSPEKETCSYYSTYTDHGDMSTLELALKRDVLADIVFAIIFGRAVNTGGLIMRILFLVVVRHDVGGEGSKLP